MKRVVHFLSDTHNQHNKLDIPKTGGDILIHCGDACVKGNFSEGLNFLQWFVKQPYKYKILCPGNHCKKLKSHPELISLAHEYGIIVLHEEDDVREILGLRIWGGQFVPSFEKLTGKARHSLERQRKAWTNMPDNLDILVTHVPPRYILDMTLNHEHIGCVELLKAVLDKKPKLHVFGHVHEHQKEVFGNENTTFMNCANMDRNYFLNFNKPIEIEDL